MREYEFTFVVQPEISEEGLEGLCQKFETVLEKAGATRLFYEAWGRRRLAYEIKKFQKGHYLVLHYLDEGQCVPEVERAARLEESVLRFLTVLADDSVTDIEARKAEGVTLEEERKQKAAERAVREAEEAAARAEEAAARAAAEAENAAAREAENAATAESASEEEAPAAEQTAPAEKEAPAAEEAANAEEAPAQEAKAEEAEQPA